MATINLGSIKFKWQGAYAGGTAYTVDDVVSYQGSSYICIQASTGNLPTNATYWEQMSSAGTNGTDGTDLTTTLTTQGDIVYRDASGLARLGAGTAGQALITNGTGANPSWGDAGGGKINQVLRVEYGSSQSFSTSAGTYNDTGVTLNITPTATSSKIAGWVYYNCGNNADVYMFLRVSRTAPTTAVVSNRVGHTPQSGCVIIDAGSMNFLDSPNTTSQCTYTLQLDTGSGTAKLNDRGDGSAGVGTSGMILMEVLA